MMASYVDLIGRIEAQIRTFRIAWMFRVINQRHAATPMDFCITHDLQGIGAVPFLIGRSINWIRWQSDH